MNCAWVDLLRLDDYLCLVGRPVPEVAMAACEVKILPSESRWCVRTRVCACDRDR